MNVYDVEKIERKALEQRRMKDLGLDTPIGDKIFDILEQQYDSILFLFPLRSKNICGFTRKKGEVTQVFINTNLSKSMQNFVCAHELYHVIETTEKDVDKFFVCSTDDISEEFSDTQEDIEELKANYFAASFLLPRQFVVDRFKNIELKKIDEDDLVLEIIKIQYQFGVPYKTIVKRLREIEIISDEEYTKLLSYESKIMDYCKMLDDVVFDRIKQQEMADNRKYSSLNISKTAADLYRKNALTFSKLGQILDKYDKTPSDFNIEEEELEVLSFDFSNYGTGDEDDE